LRIKQNNTTMKPFEEFRLEFIQTCRDNNACEPEFRRLISTDTKENFFKVIKHNINWCFQKGILSTKILLENFSVEELNSFDIYTSGEHNVVTSGQEIRNMITLESSQATVETWGSSQATVETWGSSQATVKTLESSQATVITLESSQATVKTWGSSQATVETWGSSQATVETWGSSQAKLDYSNGGLIQDRSNRKIFIKKSDYEIVLID